ncbi:hypothetical protein DPMN_088211 [Dreissena polymorpha]|uniref:Uncharacterized protein n=1 Tax=Dreissena polymorpha TaxID=45954 RepID=A0A9D4KU39_DREPO|nr:hypothetical protein DPMN_088211 [Dreissena polymorpha]
MADRGQRPQGRKSDIEQTQAATNLSLDNKLSMLFQEMKGVSNRPMSSYPSRPIIIHCLDFRDTEFILSNARKLHGKHFHINRDFPREIVDALQALTARTPEHQRNPSPVLEHRTPRKQQSPSPSRRRNPRPHAPRRKFPHRQQETAQQLSSSQPQPMIQRPWDTPGSRNTPNPGRPS